MMDTTVEGMIPLVGIVLASHLPHMGPRSLFHLATALHAMRRGDIEGSMTLHITAKKGHSIEVDWQSGPGSN